MQTTEIEVIVLGEERERILVEYDQSGLTQRAFAERQGIKVSTLI